MLLLLSVVSFCPGGDGHPCLGEDGLPRLGEDGLVYHSLAPLALGGQLGEALGDDLR